MSITTAFVTFITVAGIADILGPGHAWGSLAAATAWFFACRSLSRRGWNRLLAASLALSVAIAVLAVVQMWWLPRARGPFESPNILGAYAVLMFFVAAAGQPLAGNGASSLVLAAAANLLSLALSQSRGALLALAAGLVVLAARGRRWPLLAAHAACVAAVFLIRPGNEEARWGIWRIGLQAASQRLLLGWGQGGLVIGGLDRFYSIPLEWLINAGILGVLAGAWALTTAVRAARKDSHRNQMENSNHREPAYDSQGQSTSRFHYHALFAFLAAWFVQGLFLYGTPGTYAPLIAVMAYIAPNPTPNQSAQLTSKALKRIIST